MTRLRLTYVPMEHSEHVYVNGVEQRFGTDYNFTEPGVIDTTTAADTRSGDTLECYYAHQDELVPPPDDPIIVGNLVHLNYDYAFVFTLPAEVLTDDLMIVTTYHWHGTGVASGWSDWYPGTGTGNAGYRVQAKFITTEDPGDIITIPIGQGWRGAGVMQIVRNVNKDAPLHMLSQGVAPSLGSVTAATDRIVAVHMAVRYQGSGPVNINRGTTTVSLDNGELGAQATRELLTVGQTVTAGISNGWGASVVLRSN